MEIEQYPGKTLVALSGGADSVALLRLLTSTPSPLTSNPSPLTSNPSPLTSALALPQCEALHCNFHLRGAESDRDEQFCRSLCERLGVPLHVRHFQTREYAREQGISLEMAARQLRYQWFEEMRQRLGAQQIAVAHHRDDQVETLLLNLVRGTGLRGLAGMQSRTGYIVRPLLRYSKAELLQYLDGLGQDYVTDSTNLERDALRNRLRLDVIPLLQQFNPQASRHIAQTAERVAEALPYYIQGVDGSEELSATTLHERLYGLGFTPAQEADILRSTRSGALFESPTHRLVRHRGLLLIEPKDQPDLPPRLTTTLSPLTSNPSPLTSALALTCHLDAALVEQPLSLRHPRRGDRFRPLGMERGTRLISDYLTDRHLSLFDKQRQWLLCDARDRILWVCGLQPDHRFRVTSETRNVLVVTLSYR